jgi:hypothetical protein
VPFAADTWLAAKVIAAVVAVAALEALLLHLGAWFLAVGTLLPRRLGIGEHSLRAEKQGQSPVAYGAGRD